MLQVLRRGALLRADVPVRPVEDVEDFGDAIDRHAAWQSDPLLQPEVAPILRRGMIAFSGTIAKTSAEPECCRYRKTRFGMRDERATGPHDTRAPPRRRAFVARCANRGPPAPCREMINPLQRIRA